MSYFCPATFNISNNSLCTNDKGTRSPSFHQHPNSFCTDFSFFSHTYETMCVSAKRGRRRLLQTRIIKERGAGSKANRTKTPCYYLSYQMPWKKTACSLLWYLIPWNSFKDFPLKKCSFYQPSILQNCQCLTKKKISHISHEMQERQQ